MLLFLKDNDRQFERISVMIILHSEWILLGISRESYDNFTYQEIKSFVAKMRGKV